MEGDVTDFLYSLYNGGISIHSLRMEGDVLNVLATGLCIISIHSLRMEGDTDNKMALLTDFAFQSTPSAWRETAVQWRCTYIF